MTKKAFLILGIIAFLGLIGVIGWKYYEFYNTPLTIVCIGDSLTEGYKVHNPYPRYLEELTDGNIYNWGVGSITLEEIHNVFVERRSEVESADVLIIWGGANDIRLKHSLEEMKAETEELLKDSKEYAEERILVTVPPTVNWNDEDNLKAREFNTYLKTLDLPISDAAEMFKDYTNENQLDPDYELRGIHLTEDGYEIIAKHLYGIINNMNMRSFPRFVKRSFLSF